MQGIVGAKHEFRSLLQLAIGTFLASWLPLTLLLVPTWRSDATNVRLLIATAAGIGLLVSRSGAERWKDYVCRSSIALLVLIVLSGTIDT